MVTREEQKQITEFVERAVKDQQAPMDVEADAIIRALFVRNPDAAYRITMMAMAQQRELSSIPDTEDATEPRRGWLAFLFERRGANNVRREPVMKPNYQS